MTDYTPVWSGKTSLHDVFLSPRDVLLWQTRGNALVASAPDLDGISKKRVMRREGDRARLTEPQATTRERQRAAGALRAAAGEQVTRRRGVPCPACGALGARVVHYRVASARGVTRLRECRACRQRYLTHELVGALVRAPRRRHG